MLKGYKTMIVNGALALFAIIAILNPGAELPTAEEVGGIVDQADAVILLIVAAVNMVLRAVTSSPIFNRQPKE